MRCRAAKVRMWPFHRPIRRFEGRTYVPLPMPLFSSGRPDCRIRHQECFARYTDALLLPYHYLFPNIPDISARPRWRSPCCPPGALDPGGRCLLRLPDAPLIHDVPPVGYAPQALLFRSCARGREGGREGKDLQLFQGDAND